MQHDLHAVRRIAAVVVSILSYTLGSDRAHAEDSNTAAHAASAAHEAPTRSATANAAPEPPTRADAVNARPAEAAWASARSALWPIAITDEHTQRTEVISLYDGVGNVDEAAAERLDDLLCDARNPTRIRTTVIERRTLQLIFRAAYHFGAHTVDVISGYRQPGRRSEGRHGEGRAIDFRLPSISAPALASYLRRLPRVGVGLYTHPGTRFVHLDVRDRSYHWLDASPPGISWRERPLGSNLDRDARYARRDDWPEGIAPPGEESGGGETSPVEARTFAARSIE